MKKTNFQFSIFNFQLLLIITICLHFTGCTIFLYKKGNIEVDNLQYIKAIKDYSKVIEKKDFHNAKIKLANCYRLTNALDKAEPLYAVIVEYPDIKPIELFHYAKILMSKGDYPNAKIWFAKYLLKVPGDMNAMMLMTSCDSLNVFMRDTTLFTLKGLNFNELASVFSSVPYKNGMVFTAEKEELKNSKKNPWTGKSYLDLYYSEKDASGKWSTPQPLKGVINGSRHEGPASFNRAGDVIYFTRSNYYRNKPEGNDENVNTLKLFKAKLVNGVWQDLEELPFNGDDYSVGHPFISKDEKTLYFISNMPGGYGGTDIYRSTLDSNKWSKPENLGDAINTPGNEMFPVMADDSMFYFSSDEHTNMGGLDVFETSYDEKNKRWRAPENLRFPLNSPKDDFGMILNADGKTGYVSSNRNGADKIYEFEKHDPTLMISGFVTLKGIGTPLDSITIDLIDQTTKKKITVLTDKNGMYQFKLEPKTKYLIVSSKDGYFTLSQEVSTKGKKVSENMKAENFEMEKIVIEKPIVLENIYYDLDKWKIRKDAKPALDKLVQLLKDNPDINIEMGSHTDSRAGDDYNLLLSDKRAKAAVQYLISKGIKKDRLEWKGYGETRLVNRCSNGIECTEEEHQQNRRTEFKVVKINSPGK